MSRTLQETLKRNGMNAEITNEDGRYRLTVQTKDSPPITYDITQAQARAMAASSNVGTGYANKKAYNVLYSIVSKDFNLPSNYVYAAQAGSNVNMGQNGYRSVSVEPSRMPWLVPGYGGRRVVVEHISRERPGGIAPGQVPYNEGASWKGTQSSAYSSSATGRQSSQEDLLGNLQNVFVPTPPSMMQREEKPAVAYSSAIASDVYFTKEAFNSVLESHGIQIDADKRLLTVTGRTPSEDRFFDISKEQIVQIYDTNLKTSSLQSKVDVINSVIGSDYKNGITVQMLESAEPIHLELKPELAQQLQQQQQARLDASFAPTPNMPPTAELYYPRQAQGRIDGMDIQDINGEKSWYREGRHGREVDVAQIWVEKVEPSARLTAVILPDAQQNPSVSAKEGKTDITVTLGTNGKPIYQASDHQITQEEVLAANKYLRSHPDVIAASADRPFVISLSKDDIVNARDASVRIADDQKNLLKVVVAQTPDGSVLVKGVDEKLNKTEMRNIAEFLKAHPEFVPEPGEKVTIGINQKDALVSSDVKYKMSAVIDGNVVSHEISKKDYEKYLSVDDYQRMRMVSKEFDEVDLKNRPEFRTTAGDVMRNIGAAALAIGAVGLGVAGAKRLAVQTPEFYDETHGSRTIYFKPGVDTPESLAERAFDAGKNAAASEMAHGYGR